jgi:hypothetical protein
VIRAALQLKHRQTGRQGGINRQIETRVRAGLVLFFNYGRWFGVGRAVGDGFQTPNAPENFFGSITGDQCPATSRQGQLCGSKALRYGGIMRYAVGAALHSQGGELPLTAICTSDRGAGQTFRLSH